MAKIEPEYIEFYKAFFDYLKHLTTLSTGSVILIAAFLEKLFVQPSWKFLVAVSLVGFMVSVVSSVVAHSILILKFDPVMFSDDWEQGPALVALVIAWMFFLIGIITLTIFAIRNFF